MGGITSKPKPKPQPQVVYVPQPAPPPPEPVPVEPAQPEQTPEEKAAEQRRKSLLGRDRGRFGTVLTSFRGLLSQSDGTSQRKTLLGE